MLKFNNGDYMKVKNLNSSSLKTKELIKKTFAEMLEEKKELSKITVTELVKRASINRGTFYAHYDDIYKVAEDYENELIDSFFSNAELLRSTDFGKFIDSFFNYIKGSDKYYKMLCKSNDFLFSANRLTTLAANKILELCYTGKRIKNEKNIDMEIRVFIDGLVCEYVKYCRGMSTNSPDDLYLFTEDWCKNFVERRF